MAKMSAIAPIASDAVWEPIFGYSRAVRAGDWIAVSGTTSFDHEGKIVGYGQMYVQARQAIANIASALERAEATLADVVRTRMFTTDMRRFEEIARAHRESFGATLPATTLVEVRRLVHPDLLFEIEADAYAPNASGARLPRGASKRALVKRSGTSKRVRELR
jgi:enamine deaminase RidA (YjgF/YER057c/UK114 family)